MFASCSRAGGAGADHGCRRAWSALDRSRSSPRTSSLRWVTWTDLCTEAAPEGVGTMLENTRGGAGRAQVREGMDVLDQNGEKIGKAGETLGGGRYFNVDAGFLGMHEYYVPFDAVTEVQEDAVFVNVTKDRLGEMGW